MKGANVDCNQLAYRQDRLVKSDTKIMYVSPVTTCTTVRAHHMFNYRPPDGKTNKVRKLVGVNKGNKWREIHVVQFWATCSEIRMNQLFHKYIEIQPINANFSSSTQAAYKEFSGLYFYKVLLQTWCW